MAINDFDRWREEVIQTGRIVQDDAPLEELGQGEERTWRYIELLEMAEGVFEQRVFQTLVDSLQANEDYGVYQTPFRMLFAFPPRQFGEWLALALPALIVRLPDWAGDFLSAMVNSHQSGDTRLVEFRQAMRLLPTTDKEEIHRFILHQEDDGWLEKKPGWYEAAFKQD